MLLTKYCPLPKYIGWTPNMLEQSGCPHGDMYTYTHYLCNMFWCNRLIVDKTLQYIPRNMHTVFALLCFVVVIHWLIFPYSSGLLHWHCGNLTIAPVPAKQSWWIWINTSCEFIMNDCITTTKQSTTKPCAYFLGYTVDEYYDAELIHPKFYYTSFPEFRCTGSIDAIESKGRKLFVV